MNRTILDQKVSIIAFEWYYEIRKGYFSIRQIIAGTELENPKIRYEQRAEKTLLDFPALCSMMRGLVDEVRTKIQEQKGHIFIADLKKDIMTIS